MVMAARLLGCSVSGPEPTTTVMVAQVRGCSAAQLRGSAAVSNSAAAPIFDDIRNARLLPDGPREKSSPSLRWHQKCLFAHRWAELPDGAIAPFGLTYL